MQTYLITGGAGFIGSSLSEKLIKEGNKVVTIDNFCDFYNPTIKENNVKELIKNSNFKLYRNDIRDSKRTFDTVYWYYVWSCRSLLYEKEDESKDNIEIKDKTEENVLISNPATGDNIIIYIIAN